MECANHPGAEPAARCVTCGKYLCRDCVVERDKIYCATCAPRERGASGSGPSPWLEGLEPGRAFSYILDDPGWFARLLVGALLLLGSFLLVPLFIALGYQVELVRRVAAGEDVRLPRWDGIGLKLKEGFLYSMVMLLYALPVLAVLSGVVVIGIAAGRWTHGALQALAMFLFLAGWLLVLAGAVLLRLAAPAIISRFALAGGARGALRLREVAGEVRANIRPYLVVLLLTWFLLVVIAPLGSILCCVAGALTGFYSLMVDGHLCGQLARFSTGPEARDA